MHQTSLDLMKKFVKKYLPQNSKVLDFGGSQSYDSYKNIIIEHNCSYETLDWSNADYIVNGYDWSNIPKKHFDAVISGQAFEHDLYFWKTFENIKNIVKDGGLVMFIVPSKGNFHQYPVDCYRYYPDSALVFAEILNAEILDVIWNSNEAVIAKRFSVNKSIIFTHEFDTEWGDLGMAFKLKKTIKTMKNYSPIKIENPKCRNISSAWGDIPTILKDIVDRFQIPRNKALEFGVEYGYSTSAISNYFDSVIGVDTFLGDEHAGFKQDHYEQTKNDLAEFTNIQLIQSDYEDFIKNNNDNYDLIHIDIVHTYEHTYKCGEWAVQHSKVTIFHDTESFPAIKSVCEDLANNFDLEFYNYPYSNGLGILVKKEFDDIENITKHQYDDINITLKIEENKIYVNTQKDYENVKIIITDSNHFMIYANTGNLSNNVTYWYSPNLIMKDRNGIIVRIFQNEKLLIEKKFETKSNKFNYIIAAYFGERRAYPIGGENFLDAHLNYFNTNKIDLLNRIIVVLNINVPSDLDKLEVIKKKYQNLNVTYIVKENIGGSYYNYQLAILNSFSLDPDIDYTFIIEDDYMPFDPEFYKPFFNKIQEEDNVIYVCQRLLLHYHKQDVLHPAISNGLFDLKKLRKFYYKNNKLFDVSSGNDYLSFEMNQINFPEFLRADYKFLDLAEYCQPFYKNLYVVWNFGNRKNDILIKPIIFGQYFIRKMKINDIEFFLSIRNECSEKLHDNRKFTLDEAKDWFTRTNPDFYIINYDNVDIGYFRTSNYSNKNIYIGCDIHKDWRGKKLSYDAYLKFIDYIFCNYDIDKITLEVLSNNTVAHNLYKKLGFIEKSLYPILRNNEYVNSIIMSLNKEDFYSKINVNFDVSFDGDEKIYISTKESIETVVFICNGKENISKSETPDPDSILYSEYKKFEVNTFWFSIYNRIRNYESVKILITNKVGVPIFLEELKIK